MKKKSEKKFIEEMTKKAKIKKEYNESVDHNKITLPDARNDQMIAYASMNPNNENSLKAQAINKNKDEINKLREKYIELYFFIRTLRKSYKYINKKGKDIILNRIYDKNKELLYDMSVLNILEMIEASLKRLSEKSDIDILNIITTEQYMQVELAKDLQILLNNKGKD